MKLSEHYSLKFPSEFESSCPGAGRMNCSARDSKPGAKGQQGRWAVTTPIATHSYCTQSEQGKPVTETRPTE